MVKGFSVSCAAYLWQTIENKQKFISQIMTSKSPVRSCEDVDEAALSYACRTSDDDPHLTGVDFGEQGLFLLVGVRVMDKGDLLWRHPGGDETGIGPAYHRLAAAG